MSTATIHEPLRAVPPNEQMKERFAALLAAREAARRAFDAIMAAPRKAAGFIGRLVTALHLNRPLGWLTRALSRAGHYAAWAVQQLGRLGVVSAVGAVVTSPTGQAVIRKVGGILGRGLGWFGRAAYKMVDSGLRLFGRPGNRAADALFAFVVRVGGRFASVATGVVDRVARITDPDTDHMRLLDGLSRGYLLHRISRLLVRNRWVRALVETFLIPTLADNRVWDWLKRLTRELAARLRSLREQRATVTLIREMPGGAIVGRITGSPAVDDDEQATPDLPEPGNRAERRAMQREQARRRHHPVTT